MKCSYLLLTYMTMVVAPLGLHIIACQDLVPNGRKSGSKPAESAYILVSVLQELWLQHNQIASHSQLLSLTTMSSLAVLFLAPNPVCDSLKEDYRAATVSAIPSLQVDPALIALIHYVGRLHDLTSSIAWLGTS